MIILYINTANYFCYTFNLGFITKTRSFSEKVYPCLQPTLEVWKFGESVFFYHKSIPFSLKWNSIKNNNDIAKPAITKKLPGTCFLFFLFQKTSK